MKRFLLYAASLTFMLGHAGVASATIITNQVGTPELTNSTSLGATLTSGFIVADFSWTHSYTPITGTINSATLAFDTTDLDTQVGIVGSLFNGTNLIATFTGGDNGGNPQDWLGLGDNDDNLFSLSSVFFPALLTGSFAISAVNTQVLTNGNANPNLWGSNRALLTIDFTPASTQVPEPSTLGLLGAGLLGLFMRRKRVA